MPNVEFFLYFFNACRTIISICDMIDIVNNLCSPCNSVCVTRKKLVFVGLKEQIVEAEKDARNERTRKVLLLLI